MKYDITTKVSAIETLVNLLDLPEEEIKSFVKSFLTDEGFDFRIPDSEIHSFLSENNRSIDDINISEIEFSAIHLTTSNNECKSIQKHGLLNTKKNLSVDTPLKRFLNQRGVFINIENHKLVFAGKEYEFNYDINLNSDKGSLEKKINNVARKIYDDYMICGFFYNDSQKFYLTPIGEYPEIIGNISDLHDSLNMLKSDWAVESKPYIIKFTARFHQFTYYTFYQNKGDFLNDFYTQKVAKLQLIQRALNRIRYCQSKGDYVYMKENSIISPDKIKIINFKEWKERCLNSHQ